MQTSFSIPNRAATMTMIIVLVRLMYITLKPYFAFSASSLLKDWPFTSPSLNSSLKDILSTLLPSKNSDDVIIIWLSNILNLIIHIYILISQKFSRKSHKITWKKLKELENCRFAQFYSHFMKIYVHFDKISVKLKL